MLWVAAAALAGFCLLAVTAEPLAEADPEADRAPGYGGSGDYGGFSMDYGDYGGYIRRKRSAEADSGPRYGGYIDDIFGDNFGDSRDYGDYNDDGGSGIYDR